MDTPNRDREPSPAVLGRVAAVFVAGGVFVLVGAPLLFSAVTSTAGDPTDLPPGSFQFLVLGAVTLVAVRPLAVVFRFLFRAVNDLVNAMLGCWRRSDTPQE